MPIYSPTGFLDITNATLRTSNTECQNLKIGTGNLYVTSEISPSFELNLSNVTDEFEILLQDDGSHKLPDSY